MITEKDLQEAIAECQGERSPNASTCIKLAAFYTIKEHLYPDQVKNTDPEPFRRVFQKVLAQQLPLPVFLSLSYFHTVLHDLLSWHIEKICIL